MLTASQTQQTNALAAVKEDIGRSTAWASNNNVAETLAEAPTA